jgi:hypothetical protein
MPTPSIPEHPHELNALRALNEACGTDAPAAELRQRAASEQMNIDTAFESFRNNAQLPLAEFLKVAGRAITLRQRAETRLRTVDPTAVIPDRLSPALELHQLITSAKLRRDAAISQLRDDRLHRMDTVRRELEAVERDIRHLAQQFAHSKDSFDVESDQRHRGDHGRIDGALGRLQPLVARRDHLSRQLERLDGYSNPIGVTVSKAVEAAGGKAAVALVIADTAVHTDQALGQAAKQLSALEARLQNLDPDSQTAKELAAQRPAAAAALDRAKADAVTRRIQQAEQLLEKAMSGDLTSAMTVRARAPEALREAIDAGRGKPDQIIGTIEAIITSE